MAKGNFLTTVVRGKLGNMVGYKNSQSNNAEKQAWRAYVSQIGNPRTEAQARQRMIVANLLQNYAALKPIIARGFENVGYGGPSYRRFLKLNMTRAGQGPFVVKGRKSPVPGPYQISEGSLIPVTVTGRTSLIANRYFLQSDVASAGLTTSATLTWGQVSRGLIEGNTDIQNGDQLTFIEVAETSNLSYIFRYKSLIVDTEDTTVLGTADEEVTYLRTINGVIMGKTTAQSAYPNSMYFTLSQGGDEVPVAGAVIQSRQGLSGGWLRSSASLWVAELEDYFSEDIYRIALESYMNPDSSRTSDWPTEEDPDITSAWATVLKIVSATVGEETTNGIPALTITNGERSLLVVRTVNGTDMICYRDGSAQTFPASSVTTATDGTVNVTELASYGITL